MKKIMKQSAKEVTLEEYFILKGVDEIEDDEEFMKAELNAMVEYFATRDFSLADDDVDTLIGRGLYDDFELERLNWEEWRELEERMGGK